MADNETTIFKTPRNPWETTVNPEVTSNWGSMLSNRFTNRPFFVPPQEFPGQTPLFPPHESDTPDTIINSTDQHDLYPGLADIIYYLSDRYRNATR